MIAQIVQKLFGPITGGGGGPLPTPHAVIMGEIGVGQAGNFAQMAGADSAADMPAMPWIDAPQLGGGAAKPAWPPEGMDADDALLAGLIVLGESMAVPNAAPAQLLADVQTSPLGAWGVENSQTLPETPQIQGLTPQSTLISDSESAAVAPFDVPERAGFDLAGFDAASLNVAGFDLAGLDVKTQISGQSAQVPSPSGHSGAQGADTDTATAIHVALGSQDIENKPQILSSNALPAAALRSVEGGGNLATLHVDARPLGRFSESAQVLPNGAAAVAARVMRGPSLAQLSFQGIVAPVFGDPQAHFAARAEAARTAENAVSGDESGVHGTRLLGAAQIMDAQMSPTGPSQNIINFSLLQADQAAIAGAELGLGALPSDGAAPLGLLGEPRSGGAAGPVAGPQNASSPAFGAAPVPSAALSAQILPLTREAQNGGVDLTLSPIELGQLRFEMRQVGEQMQILLSAERPETLDLLRRHGDALRNDFAAAGFAGASLNFGNWGQGRDQSPPPQFSPQYQDQPTQNAPSVLPPPSVIWPQKGDAGRALNLRV